MVDDSDRRKPERSEGGESRLHHDIRFKLGLALTETLFQSTSTEYSNVFDNPAAT
jgi:hypothetical protein